MSNKSFFPSVRSGRFKRQVAKIESERLLGLSVQMELEKRSKAGLYAGKFEAQYHYFGYEGRCALPSPLLQK